MPWEGICSCFDSIIRESYAKTDISERPKIFGMTASPMDGKGDIIDAAM